MTTLTIYNLAGESREMTESQLQETMNPLFIQMAINTLEEDRANIMLVNICFAYWQVKDQVSFELPEPVDALYDEIVSLMDFQVALDEIHKRKLH